MTWDDILRTLGNTSIEQLHLLHKYIILIDVPIIIFLTYYLWSVHVLLPFFPRRHGNSFSFFFHIIRYTIYPPFCYLLLPLHPLTFIPITLLVTSVSSILIKNHDIKKPITIIIVTNTNTNFNHSKSRTKNAV